MQRPSYRDISLKELNERPDFVGGTQFAFRNFFPLPNSKLLSFILRGKIMAEKKKAVQNRSHATGYNGPLEWETSLSAFAEASVDVFVLFDKNLNLLGINPAGERLVGLTRENTRASLGRNLKELLPYVAKTERYQKYLEVVRTGVPFIVDDVVLHPVLGNIHLSVKAFKAGDGLGIIASDITERRRIEDALANSEEWHSALVDAAGKAGLGITIVQNNHGKEAAIVYVNDEYCKMIGYSREELFKMSEFDLISPPDLQMVQDRYRRRQGGYNVTCFYEMKMLRKNGTSLPVENSTSTMIYRGRIATVSYYRDITNRKRVEEALRKAREGLEIRVEERTKELATTNEVLRHEIIERERVEQALRESEEKLRIMYESVNEGITVTDLDGEIVQVNEAVLKLQGCDTKEEIIGLSAFDFISENDRSRAREDQKRTLENGYIRGIEYTFLTKGGKEFYGEMSAAVLKDASGNPFGFISVTRDATKRKQAQDTLQKLYQQEKDLRQQLEDEMRKRVEFTRALAHELKTPLTPMLISSQALVSKLEDELLLSFARNINRGALNLNSRIDELLDLAKGEIGMLQLKAEPLDVLQLLREVLEYVSPVALNREQTLIAEMPPSLPVVNADKVRLRQVVLNLLNNALKYTQERGKITLRADKTENTIIIEVKDNGPGIDEKGQAQLFEPYHRNGMSGERLSGLGLGLSLCKKLVELHGGKIWVRSQVGKGSVFAFSIPLELRNSVNT
jgi:PAS domain S-box-containing protein